MAIKAGQLITDGDAVWIIDDVRDGARVGDIILRPTLRDGYIKANGATVKASEYPRLLAWARESNMAVTAEQYQTDCSKYVYDSAQDKLTLPNATGRVLQGGEQVWSVEAGLPNITGRLGEPLLYHTDSKQYGGSGSAEITQPDGAFVKTSTALRHVEGDAGKNYMTNMGINFDASKSNPIYGASATVQPPAISLIAQIKY